LGQIFVHDSRVKSIRKHLHQLIASAILYIFGKTDFNRDTTRLPEALTAAATEWLCSAQCRVAELSWFHCNSLCLFKVLLTALVQGKWGDGFEIISLC